MSIETWSIQQVREFLGEKGCDERVQQSFESNCINGEALLLLKEGDVKELSLPLASFLKVRKVLQELHDNQSALPQNVPSSPVPLGAALVTGISSPMPLDSAINPGTPARCSTPSSICGTPFNSSFNSSVCSSPDSIFCSPNQAALTFDMIAILQEVKTGQAILKEYADRIRAYITESERVEIVNIAYNYLVRTCGHYPSRTIKEKLAKAIVFAFPCLSAELLQGEVVDESKILNQHYSHFYCSRTGGYLETKLKKGRKALPKESRKRVEREREGVRKRLKLVNGFVPMGAERLETTDQDTLDYKIRWLKTHPGTAVNVAQISEYMADTFNYRAIGINKAKDATEALEENPRYIDTDFGRLIYADFLLKYPGAIGLNKFVVKYCAALQRITEEDEAVDSIPVTNNDSIRAILMLLRCLPGMKRIKRVNYDGLRDRVFQCVKDNCDVADFVTQRPSNLLKQPFLVVVGSLDNPQSFILVIDNISIPCGAEFDVAFQNLFACFYIFHLEFPSLLQPFYSFLKDIIFQILPPITPSNVSFRARLERTRQALANPI